MGHKYKITLTPNEVDTIAFLASRGYCEAVYEALMHEDTLCEPNDPATDYYIPEYLAWGILHEWETNGGHGFGPAAETLNGKLYSLLWAIE